MKRTHILLVAAMTMLAVISTVGTASAVKTDEFNVVMAAALANNGAVPPLGQITPVALNTLLTDGNPANDPLIVDLRSADEFAKGHIAGAMNVYYRTLGDAGVIAGLSSALAAHVASGKANSVISYGNTHHEKAIATYLSVQGFPVKNINHGLADWTKNEVAAPGRYKRCTTFDAVGHGIAPAGCNTNNFPTTTTNPVNASTLSGKGYPTIDCISGPVTSADLAAITRCTYNARYGDMSKPEFATTAAAVYDVLDDNQDGVMAGAGDDTSNDPFVLSNRGTLWNMPTCTVPGPYYDRGHIPGAVAVDWCSGPKRMEVKALDLTDFMPQNNVVHHCWVGQSQQYGMSWYPLLGYEVTSMNWGMNSWTDSDYVRQAVINPAQYTSNFPVEAYAKVNILPTTLNTKSKGDYVTVRIVLPSGYDNTIINTGTIKLAGALSPVYSSADADGVTAKFSRAAVIALVSPGSNTLTVTGSGTIAGGTLNFIGRDTITAL